MLITIFTPTYNRSTYLKRLYLSLKDQKAKNFIWLIIDDGSTDNTETIVSDFINSENNFKIIYFKKENGGKHTAINYGVKKVNTPIVGIMDSDDWLSVNATEIIENNWESIKNKSNVAGILALSEFNSGEIIGEEFPQNNWEVSFADIYLKYKVNGDKAVFFKTDILKKYPFPEKEGINFVFEATVWHEMAKKYNVFAINRVLQKKEYLSEGITRNSYKMNYIKGLAFSYFTLIKNKTYSLKKYPHHFFWNYIHLAINSLLSHENYFKKLSLVDKFFYLICFPRAYFSYTRISKKIENK